MKSSNFNCICLLSVILLIALAFPVYIESFRRRKRWKKFKSDNSDTSDNSDNSNFNRRKWRKKFKSDTSDTSDNSNREISRFNRKIKRLNREMNNKIKQSTSNFSTIEERDQEREKQRETVNTVQDIVNNPYSSNFVKLKKLNEIM